MTTTSHNLPNAAGILFNTLISQYKPPKAKNVAPLAISLPTMNDQTDKRVKGTHWGSHVDHGE